MNTMNEARAIDLPAGRRPGVSAQREPAPIGNAHWLTPERQPPCANVTIDAQRGVPTATFGTGQPPRGLSGTMRRAAYRIPDYEPKRWALLLLADRVDTLEDRGFALARSPVPWVALAAAIGVLILARGGLPRRRRSFYDRIFG
jgi:hypothetical protein